MNATHGATLLRLARASIETALDGGQAVVPPEPWLDEVRATFVTLHKRQNGELRGCIGSIEARRPLGEDVIACARLAAFHDTRFSPLAREELDMVRIEVSVLSPLAPLPVVSEADARATLDRTRPGVLLSYNGLSGVFLPQVWASIPNAGEFLGHLKQKAGLPARFWSPAIELHTFTCDEFSEPGVQPPRMAAP